MKLAKFNALAGGAGQYNCAVITIHGLRTRGAWQKWVTLPFQDAGIRYSPIDYDHQLVLALLRPTWRADGFIESVVQAWQDHDEAGLAVTAAGHSFGTLVLGRALQRNPDLRLQRVILAGSILSPAFPWLELARLGQVGQVLNEVSRSDLAARFARFLPSRWTGSSGYAGFTDGSGTVTNRHYSWIGHSDAVVRLHVEKVWVPFLLHGALPS
jgi:pimeloyl-ACP methyl ester carboxylesterase